jgi:pyruvate dehydrogenase E2 component (dihydrolipoamide acetyltransferase)
MEVGSIAKWCVKEGEKFEAGQALAEVETDKATVTLDATDEGFIAKILVGQGEIKVGAPLLITVDEQEHIAAFASYVAAAAPAPVAAPAKPAAPAVAAAPPAPKAAAVAPASVSAPAPGPARVAPGDSLPVSVIASVSWSGSKFRGGAVGIRLAKEQNAYASKWGFGGYSPAPLPPAPKKAKA